MPPKSINESLTFFDSQYQNQHEELIRKGIKIIESCQHLLSVIQNPETKKHLETIIVQMRYCLRNTRVTVSDAHRLNMKNLLNKMCDTVLLLHDLPQERNLASMSIFLAKLCLFIVVLSLACFIGHMVYTAYFSELSLNYFLDTLVSLSAYDLIPSGVVGIFSFLLGRLQSRESVQISCLKSDIATFCKATAEKFEFYGRVNHEFASAPNRSCCDTDEDSSRESPRVP